jgi:uracil-DNA glycosylase
VPSFGAIDARLLIVGLAPGLRGANRSGRPFTGDFAGDLLFPALIRHGFAAGGYAAGRDDDAWTGDHLTLTAARITNAVRCVPPQNKPLPVEVRTCRPFLAAEMAAMPNLRVILALGRIAHDAVLGALDVGKRKYPFVHGALHDLTSALTMADSYHCSRYNTNTGVLTPAMFERVIARLGEVCLAPKKREKDARM